MSEVSWPPGRTTLGAGDYNLSLSSQSPKCFWKRLIIINEIKKPRWHSHARQLELLSVRCQPICRTKLTMVSKSCARRPGLGYLAQLGLCLLFVSTLGTCVSFMPLPVDSLMSRIRVRSSCYFTCGNTREKICLEFWIRGTLNRVRKHHHICNRPNMVCVLFNYIEQICII